jgi:hypothetical protein
MQLKVPPGNTIIPAFSTRLRCAILFSMRPTIRAELKTTVELHP